MCTIIYLSCLCTKIKKNNNELQVTGIPTNLKRCTGCTIIGQQDHHMQTEAVRVSLLQRWQPAGKTYSFTRS